MGTCLGNPQRALIANIGKNMSGTNIPEAYYGREGVQQIFQLYSIFITFVTHILRQPIMAVS